MLPKTVNVDTTDGSLTKLLELLSNSEEIELFDTLTVREFAMYNWNMYAAFIHQIGGLIHLVYFVLFSAYVMDVYLNRNMDNRMGLLWSMLFCLVYPLMYDGIALIKDGPKEYLSDAWNYLDMGYVYLGIANILTQRYHGSIINVPSQLLMLITALIILIKSFFFLRVFTKCSVLVKMLIEVFVNLRAFMIFFMISLLI